MATIQRFITLIRYKTRLMAGLISVTLASLGLLFMTLNPSMVLAAANFCGVSQQENNPFFPTPDTTYAQLGNRVYIHSDQAMNYIGNTATYDTYMYGDEGAGGGHIDFTYEQTQNGAGTQVFTATFTDPSVGLYNDVVSYTQNDVMYITWTAVTGESYPAVVGLYEYPPSDPTDITTLYTGANYYTAISGYYYDAVFENEYPRDHPLQTLDSDVYTIKFWDPTLDSGAGAFTDWNGGYAGGSIVCGNVYPYSLTYVHNYYQMQYTGDGS